MTIRQRGALKPARKPTKNSPRATNHTVWQALGNAVTTWQGVCRMLLLVVVPIVLLLVAASMFRLVVEVGPLRIAPH